MTRKERTDMPINERDTLTPHRLPPEARLTIEGQKKQPLVSKVKEYNKLVAEWRATQHRIGVLKRDHDKAENLHQIAFAKALREGASEPSREAVLKVEEDQKATERKLNALLEALLDVEAELYDEYANAKAELNEQVAAEIDEASVVYREAIAALQAARWKLAEAVSMKRFLNTFPDEGDWRPG